MVEVYKIINGYAPLIMNNLCVFQENTNSILSFQILSNENRKSGKL